MKPSAVKFRKILHIVVCTRIKQCGYRRTVTDGNNAAGTMSFGKSNRTGTVFNQKAIRYVYVQPTGGFQMHGTLVRKVSVIINNLISFKPAVKTEGFKIEINVG